MSESKALSHPPWLPAEKTVANIEFVHTLRGVAILIVVFVHLAGWWLGAHNRSWIVFEYYKRLWPDPLRLYQAGGHLSVVLFFLISGYIITHVSFWETQKQFIVKRFFRLFPMIVLGCIAMLAMAHLSRFLGHPDPLGFQGNFTLKNFFESIFLVNWPRGTPYITSVAWTLFIEVVFYALISAVINHQRRAPLLSTCFILAVLGAVSLVHHQTTLFKTLHLTELANFTPFVAVLTLGRTFYFLHRSTLPKHKVLATSLACAFTFAITYHFQWPGKLLSETLSTYYVGAMIFLLLMQWASLRTPRPLLHISNISYSFYLLHIPLGCLVLELLNGKIPFSVSFLITLCIAIATCTATYQWIEVPFQKFGRKILRPTRS